MFVDRKRVITEGVVMAAEIMGVRTGQEVQMVAGLSDSMSSVACVRGWKVRHHRERRHEYEYLGLAPARRSLAFQS